MPVTDNVMHEYLYNSCNILCNMQQLLDYMSQYLIVKLWVINCIVQVCNDSWYTLSLL